MREVIIRVVCDACDEEVAEEVEGSSAITFTVRGEQRVLDLCDECLSGTFLQEARPVKKSKKKGGEFACAKCGKKYARETNRDKHQEGCTA